MKYIVSASYGNDSVALIQWANENPATIGEEVHVVYCDTGWAAPSWERRVKKAEKWAQSLGFDTHRTQSIGFEELVRVKQAFPSNQYQFCTAILKGVPFLEKADEIDPEGEATVMVGKRRAESVSRQNTPEFVERSEYHGDRRLWHPLVDLTDEDRNEILKRTPFTPLSHRSLECSPCVNANRRDFKALTTAEIERVNALEVELGKPMYRPKRYGTLGIHGVIAWAHHGTKRMHLDPDELIEGSGCDGHYGCGL